MSLLGDNCQLSFVNLVLALQPTEFRLFQKHNLLKIAQYIKILRNYIASQL